MFLSFRKLSSLSCNKFEDKVFEITLFILENFDLFIDYDEFSTQQKRKANANKSAQ